MSKFFAKFMVLYNLVLGAFFLKGKDPGNEVGFCDFLKLNIVFIV